MSEKVKVWWDKKRGYHVSDAAFVLAKLNGVPPAVAGHALVLHFAAQPEHELWQHVERIWVS